MPESKEVEPNELDVVKESVAYVLVKISIDNFSGAQPTDEDMRAIGRQYAKDSTAQLMLTNSIMTYEATPLEAFVWYDTEEELKAAQENGKTK